MAEQEEQTGPLAAEQRVITLESAANDTNIAYAWARSALRALSSERGSSPDSEYHVEAERELREAMKRLDAAKAAIGNLIATVGS